MHDPTSFGQHFYTTYSTMVFRAQPPTRHSTLFETSLTYRTIPACFKAPSTTVVITTCISADERNPMDANLLNYCICRFWDSHSEHLEAVAWSFGGTPLPACWIKPKDGAVAHAGPPAAALSHLRMK